MGKWTLIALAAAVTTLTACSEGPEVRQNFAQCKIQNEWPWWRPYEGEPRMTLCMQARGFIMDSALQSAYGKKCLEEEYPGVLPSCYRRDSWFAGLLASLR